MKKAILLFAAAVATISLCSAGTINIGTYGVSAGATFLEQDSVDNCGFGTKSVQCTGAGFFAPTILDLTSLSLTAGSTITLTAGGSLNYGNSTVLPAVLDAVFSTSNTLNPSNVATRVPGAAAVGLPSGLTSPVTSTFYGLNNDIAQDFKVTTSGITFTIPNGALYLFIGISDSFMADNSGNVSINITETIQNTPEPATYFMMLGGLGALALARKFRA